ncbi:MAG: type I phosphomannose isomerase catalytic subunit [Akkermansiaceae bacterium]
MEPITFVPLYMTRVWGGRSLETLYRRALPDEQPYGESWEMTDRPDEQSIVSEGPYAGKTLHELWMDNRAEIFGDQLEGDRFPLLIKILDARDDLSIQVHPPAEIAPSLGGEPKTEMWYIADCEPKAKLYLGFKKGVSREEFEESLSVGTCAEMIHAVLPKPGDSIFIPSGRLHAIGAGFVIYEIQQNSDTTYRVFDWNRVGLDGSPRDLHLDESLKSIDFNDFEPAMDTPDGSTLAKCDYFVVDQHHLPSGSSLANPSDSFSIVAVISGEVSSQNGRTFMAGDFLLLPRNASPLIVSQEARILQTHLPLHPRHILNKSNIFAS